MRELIIHSLVATLPASITLIGVQAAPSCPRRATIGIGADSNVSASGTLFGVAQEVDIGDGVAVDYARVFGGSYQSLAGGAGGALNGANSTLQRWAFSIGGTAAHEAGHTYGLQHDDDFLQTLRVPAAMMAPTRPRPARIR